MWHRRSRSFPQATTETAFNSKPATGFRAYVSRNVGVRKSPLQRLRICSDTNKTIRKTVFHHHRKCLIAQIEGILAQSNNCWFRRRLCYRERLGVFALAELRKRFFWNRNERQRSALFNALPPSTAVQKADVGTLSKTAMCPEGHRTIISTASTAPTPNTSWRSLLA